MKHDGYIPEWEEELRQGAWDILHDEPGMEFEQWKRELLTQYPAEVVDTFGTEPHEVFAMMDVWWRSEEYEDERTGTRQTYSDWATVFASPKAVEVYDELARRKAKSTL